MDIIITVEKINDVQEFTSKKGDGKVYKKFSFVGKTNEQFQKTICFTCSNEELWNKFNLVEGNDYQVHFNVLSREYQGRWFTEAIAWGVSAVKGYPSQTKPNEAPASPQPQANTEQKSDDDIPF